LKRAFFLKKIPLVFFGLCAGFFILSLYFAERNPLVSDIEPRTARPGDVLEITGNYFGEDRGKVSVAGSFPVASEYIEWSPRRIRVRVPEEASSGLVYVMTQGGRSEGLLFTNRNDIPLILGASPQEARRPRIVSLTPSRAPVGGKISLSGSGFGYERGGGEVFFTWAGVEPGTASSALEGLRFIAASELDFDYESWSDKEITLRVPSGAASGVVKVKTAGGESNGVYFELDHGSGRVMMGKKLSFTFTTQLEALCLAQRYSGELYLWLPRVQETVSQRNVVMREAQPPAKIENLGGLTLFYEGGIFAGKSRVFSQTFSFDSFGMETRVEVHRIPSGYDTGRPLYTAYTAADVFTPSTRPDVAAAARSAAGGEAHPYMKARRLYNFVLSTLSPAPGSFASAEAGLKAKSGGAFTYASLYTALLRSAGIPARTVGGYIVPEKGRAEPHFWTELYLENFGWFPADPALAGRAQAADFSVPDNPREYFFGSVTNRHVVFSRGLMRPRKLTPDGKALEIKNPHSLQTVYAEAGGTEEALALEWKPPETLLGE
jgi:hypothetical protein